MSKKYALDIFDTLAAIDRHDGGFYDRLPEQAKKGFAAPVVMRWASSVSGPSSDHYLTEINDRANVHFWEMSDHPELQYRLMASCGRGRKTRHEWVSGSKKTPDQHELHEFILRYWPHANDLEIDIIVKKLREDNTLNDFLSGTGLSPDECKRIKKLF